ncbi:GGDEF domain-containing protein [Celerinatantimonas yamalensis]|uniref:Diguanylate cyclase n=1 Tax=Celerinatantimonas yamalensis TaxID=559956 RepID=A0ABW9G5B7_9GAMM
MSASSQKWVCQQLMGPLQHELRWYCDPQSQRVWFNYRDEENCRCTLLPHWLQSLDASCRGAVQQIVAQVSGDHQSKCCHFCHDDDRWFRMDLSYAYQPQINQELLCGELICLTQNADTSDQLFLKNELGLLNCPTFRSFLIQALQSNAHNGEPLVLMALHLEDKTQVSREQLAGQLRHQLRRSDLIGLFRQQEVLVLLNGVNEQGAIRIAEKLTTVARQMLVATDGIGLTIGWALYPQDGDNVDTLIERRFSRWISS